MAQEKVTFDVLQGPSKADLQTALFHGDSDHRIKVTFRLRATPETQAKTHLSQDLRLATRYIQVQINSVQRDDGSGESWNLQGNMQIDGAFLPYSMYYSSRRRLGQLTLTLEGTTK